jgi:hypothetical protein
VAVVLEPGTAAWARLVRGPTADGILYPGARAVIALPDLPRGRPREVVLEGLSLAAAPSVLSVSVDGAPPVMAAVDERRGAAVSIPAAAHGGLRMDVTTVRGTPPARLQSVRVGGAWPSPSLALLIALLAGLATAGAVRVEAVDGRAALALAPMSAAAALVVHALATGGVSAGWPGAAIGGALLLVAGGILAAARTARASRVALARAALLVGALAFGAGARWLFAPSAGSWDMEYWRAWTETSISRGVSGAYGPPLAAGAFVPQIRGDEPLWMVTHDGRRFHVDYPPLALAAWRAAAAVVTPRDPSSWNVALKLPALAGDVLAVALLVFWWPGKRAGARAAALYWALPASWLSSATLGYLDGAYAPFVFAAAVAAGSGRAGMAGAALAVAALLKPTALVAAPAIAVALLAPRRILAAVAAGLAVVAVAVVPLALDGTLGTAVAHVLLILHQDRLSAGYANAWWLLGAALSGDLRSVTYVHVDAAAFPARAAGLIAFASAAAVIGRALARARGASATVAATAALFAAYAVLGVGVHVNHPHPLVLLFLAAGMTATAWRWPAWLFIHGYALNILLLEQLGRLAGPRYGALEKAGGLVERVRSGAGFDLTLPLAAVHVAALGFLLVRAGPALRVLQVDDPTRVDKLDERVKYDLQ